MGEKEITAMADAAAGEGFQCADHPYQANPGGICAFCLQDRLGKLLSSSNSTPFFPPPSSPTALRPLPTAPTAVRRRTKLPFFKTKTPTSSTTTTTTTTTSSSSSSTGYLRRSKSVTALGGLAELDHPHKKSFWSIFKRSNHHRATDTILTETVAPAPGPKVARSRSVGCGSRSFSGDFLERISTGFGDCALRRVESQREPRERPRGIKCGGIFGGFGMVASSSYWITAAAAAGGGGGKRGEAVRRRWGWGSFASPMRAFRPATGKGFVATGGESKPAVRATDGVGNDVSEASLPLAM